VAYFLGPPCIYNDFTTYSCASGVGRFFASPCGAQQASCCNWRRATVDESAFERRLQGHGCRWNEKEGEVHNAGQTAVAVNGQLKVCRGSDASRSARRVGNGPWWQPNHSYATKLVVCCYYRVLRPRFACDTLAT